MAGVIMLLVIITVVLCIVILCSKRSYRNRTSSVDNQYSGTKVNTDVTIEHNPSYDVIKMDNSTIKSGDLNVSDPSCSTPTKPYSEDEYNFTQYVHHSDLREMIKMDINPSYGVSTGGSSEAIKMDSNPSYGVSTGNSSEAIKMDSNPSYGVSTGEAKAAAFSSTADTKAHQSYNTTIKQYDYVYTHVSGTKP